MMDLLITGKYGLLAEQKLLGTTSNNITNVNTEGYIRKNTNVYTNVVDWGVGETYTRRMYNQFVQREMLRDQGNQAYYEAYVSGMDTIDKTLSDDALSVSNRVNALFSSLSDAVDNPTSIACREELMINCENLTDDFNTLATYTMQQITDVNGKVEDQVSVINGLTYGIYDLNRQLLANASEDSEIKLQMMDKRDYLVSQLSEIVGTSYNVEDNGTYSVYMSDGNLLVNNDVYSVFERSASEFDPTRSELYVSYRTEDAHDNKTNIRLDPTKIGGKMGGYMMSTDELRQTMRELGRLAVAIADGMNQQNRAGITLEGTAGGDIFSTTSVLGVSSDANFTCTMTYNEGEGSKLLACDFKILAYNDSGNYGCKVYSLDKHGNETELDPSTYKVSTDGKTFTMDDYGVTLTFNQSLKSNTLEENKTATIVVQPTINAAYNVSTNIKSAEEFALASAVRTRTGDNNYGDAVISLTAMTATGTDMGVCIDDSNMPAFNDNTNPPVKVVIDRDGNYDIYGSDGNQLGYAPASCKGQNIFANALKTNGSAALFTTANGYAEGYPGYEVSVTGTVREKDTFTIEINKDGVSDNSNGLYLGQLQSAGLVRANGSATQTITEGCASLVSYLGAELLKGNTALEAATAKCEQTQELYSSDSGVNLDEEAANLLRYQQCYAACSKVITASQTIFDALIQAV